MTLKHIDKFLNDYRENIFIIRGTYISLIRRPK